MKGLNFATAEEVGKMIEENKKLKEWNTKLRKENTKLIKSVTTYISSHDTEECLEIEKYWESLQH